MRKWIAKRRTKERAPPGSSSRSRGDTIVPDPVSQPLTRTTQSPSIVSSSASVGPESVLTPARSSLSSLSDTYTSVDLATCSIDASPSSHRTLGMMTGQNLVDRRLSPAIGDPLEQDRSLGSITTLSNPALEQAIGPDHSLSSDPAIHFSGEHSRMNAGGHIGSHNVSQRGHSNVNVSLGDVNQNHIHQTASLAPGSDDHQTILNRIVEKLGVYIVPQSQITREMQDNTTVCYGDTRTGVLEHILQWIRQDSIEHGSDSEEDRADHSRRCICIIGAPGSGKTTIASTVIIQLLSQAALLFPGLLTAHYRIRRDVPSTTSEDKILTTLIYQLSIRSRRTAMVVRDHLDRLPQTGVLTEQQQRDLFIETIRSHDKAVLIIIDALDEASDPAVLAAALSEIIAHEQTPDNLRLLLTTRNESPVILNLGEALVSEIALGIPTQESIGEVHDFIAGRLRDGVKTLFGPRPGWDDWPSASQIKSLSDKADGLFIWARTAVDFILARIQKLGRTGRDRWIEEVGKIGAEMADVSALYEFILRNIVGTGETNEDKVVIERVKGVLGCIIIAGRPLTLDDIVGFLGFEDFDVPHFVELARSILVPGTEPITGSTVPQTHKTFFDFITSKQASAFRINIEHHHRKAAERCFEIMASKLSFNLAGLRSSFYDYGDLDELAASIPQFPAYASTQWWYHLDHAGADQQPFDLTHIRAFLEDKLLFWLEILALLNQIWEARHWLLNLGQRLLHWQSSSDTLVGFTQDASTLIVEFEECISASIPHIYISLLALSPGDSVVANHYRKRCATAIIPHPSGVPPQWDSWDADPRMADSGSVLSVSFSPCGRRLAAGYEECTIRIWDVGSGVCVIGPLKGHRDQVKSVCFSANGLLIASGSYDKTIRVWDSETSKCMLGPLTGHTGGVRSVAFSPDSTHIASGSDDWTIRVWDVRTGNCVLGPLKRHHDYITVVSYSPDGSCIASGSFDATIRLWDAQTGACIGKLLEGLEGWISILSLSFHPDGCQLVSGSEDKTVRIWDIQNGTCTHDPLRGHTAAVSSVCFSPNGRYIASGSNDCTVRIWDAETAVCVAGPFGGASSGVTSVAFSPDGTCLAAGDRTVRLWDFKALLTACKEEASTRVEITDYTIVRAGWTLGPNGEKLFWTPQPFRPSIWRPSTVRVLGRPTMIKPDLSNLVTGEEWLQCFPTS